MVTNYFTKDLLFFLSYPQLSIISLNLFLSDNYEESDLGLYTLFDNYRNEKVIWEEMIHFIKEKQIHRISNRLIYYLSHIPWHGDIFHYGEAINQENKEYVKKEIGDFSVNTVIKLLELIDENGISRGTIGQSIESILSLVNAKEEKLKNIINDNNLTEKVRLYAAGIYAYYSGMDAIPYLKKYSNIDGIHILLEQLFKYGELNFYG